MRKKIMCLAMTLLMVVGASMTAFAEDYVGTSDWSVTFTGDKMESNFSGAEITEEVLNIQPGDSITVQVSLKNNDSVKTDWYMTNEVLNTLEESVTVAEGGAYTYILTYRDAAGVETVLYSSEVVGGEENATEAGEGLHQATNSLEDYFYLDRLEPGQTGSVVLYVQLEGETQGNDYQDTLARLQMNFAVEKVVEGTTTTVIKTVQTGDTTPMIMFSFIALISGIVLLITAVKMMNKRREKGE